MSESKWTKGPWKFYELPHDDGLHIGYIRPVDEDGLEISHHGDMGRSGNENFANGHLLAAAPELYEALINLVDSIEDAGGHDENGDVFDIREACAALAKANPSTLHAAQPKEKQP